MDVSNLEVVGRMTAPRNVRNWQDETAGRGQIKAISSPAMAMSGASFVPRYKQTTAGRARSANGGHFFRFWWKNPLAPLDDGSNGRDPDGFVNKLRTDTGGRAQGEKQGGDGGIQRDNECSWSGRWRRWRLWLAPRSSPPHSVRVSSQPGRDDSV
mmetsp:Transcript_36566/g.67648  ORF Transcript_36566/g.67648 Transcript_36566/m.67648 type:complete len:155 (+) Transcript_36566:1356-1820(+)